MQFLLQGVISGDVIEALLDWLLENRQLAYEILTRLGPVNRIAFCRLALEHGLDKACEITSGHYKMCEWTDPIELPENARLLRVTTHFKGYEQRYYIHNGTILQAHFLANGSSLCRGHQYK